VRHAQTTGNGQRYVGREDLPLDAVGLRQARDLADALRTTAIDQIWCSPLLRARQTALALVVGHPDRASRPLGLELQSGLMEIDYGDFQGLLKQDHDLALKHAHLHTRMPGGESLADVFERVGACARQLRALLASGARIVVVGHYWSNRLLRGALLGHTLDHTLALRDYKPANGSWLDMTHECVATAPPVRVHEAAP
jgi:broad specificity phosphatase PhoE